MPSDKVRLSLMQGTGALQNSSFPLCLQTLCPRFN